MLDAKLGPDDRRTRRALERLQSADPRDAPAR